LHFVLPRKVNRKCGVGSFLLKLQSANVLSRTYFPPDDYFSDLSRKEFEDLAIKAMWVSYLQLVSVVHRATIKLQASFTRLNNAMSISAKYSVVQNLLIPPLFRLEVFTRRHNISAKS